MRTLKQLFHGLGLCIVIATCLISSVSVVRGAQPFVQESKQNVDFDTQIKPLIAKYCLRCHGPENQEADFRVDDRDLVFDYIEPNDSENSEWFERISTEDEDLIMPPPDEGGPLAKEEIELFRAWIDKGADWPEDAKIEPPPKEVVEQVQQKVVAQQQEADEKANTGQLIWEIVGLLHPMAIHFPVAMLIGGAFFAILGFRGESPMSDAAYYCLWLGALGAIFAAVSGWSFGFEKNYGGWTGGPIDLNETIERHRWGGVLVAVLAFLLAITASISRRRDPYGTGAIWKLSLVLLAGLVGYVGHQGGDMTHDGVHEKLLNKSTTVYESIIGQSEATRKKKELELNQNQNSDQDNTTEGSAKTSDDKSGDDKSGDNKSGDNKSGDNKSGTDTSGEKSGGEKSGDDKSGDNKSADGKGRP